MSVAPESGPPHGGSARRRPVRLGLAVYPPLWGELLARMLSEVAWIEVVGRSAGEDELRKLTSDNAPNVIMVDYEGLGPDAEGVVARLHRLAPGVRVLVLARRSDEQAVVSLLRTGAAGLIGKNVDLPTLVKAVRAVASGEVWADRRATAQVLEQLCARQGVEPQGHARLTPREWDVVEAVGRGLRNREIAKVLGIGDKTVKTRLNHIFSKLHLKSRFALALWAQGELQPGVRAAQGPS